MLPSVHRMRRSPDFATAVRRGRRTGRRRLVVHLLPGPSGSGARDPAPGAVPSPTPPALVGFVVSRAVGGAVVRNRVERRLRAQVAQRLHLLPPDSRVVVRATPAAAQAVSAELGADLDSALRSLLRPAP
ncbi:ribonuclease P protein component [Quadrisphaera sp. DSM 44207]|uniref:ribonuclease P protein component n=1 Tax=Quadrisphaera sp. DSM 44207 TaxID=1881057 RepID=UPI000884ABEF|nr:ribonuclease P protein component [Quadrisphaera sp. DSM 44207]SDQ23184.1 ribonuclease P protein component [Quadrisphaera sp. DSM 44207]